MDTSRFATITFLLLCFFMGTPSFAQQLNHVQGEILVKLKANTNARQWAASQQQFRGTPTDLQLRKQVSQPMNIYAFTFDWTQINERQLLDAVLQDPAVEVAQFNHFVKFRATTPDDPQFDQQWQYINTGQSGGTAGADIDADLAWDITTGGLTVQGDTIVVCIIDGGFEITHEDLADNIWYNYAEIPNNGIDDDNNGFVDDRRGWNTGQGNDNVTQGDAPFHGTAVAGIVGAKGNNGVGVAGVNWNVKMMLVSGGTGVESEVLEAYSYPLGFRKKYNETNGQEGAFVVATNASWGVDGGQPANAPLWCAFYDTLGVHGIISAGATINGNQNVDTFGDLPTACPSDYLIAVTNMDHNDQKVTQAGYGSTHIDLGAFGEGTWTVASGNSYGGFGGTSGATPHVAGAIALLYAAPCSDLITLAKTNPGAAALQVKAHILNGGDMNASLQGITVTGNRLNVNNSIQLLLNSCGPCPAPGGLSVSDLTDTQVNLNWVSSNNSLSDTLRWRTAGSIDWNVVAGATAPYTLDNLTACTSYEFQVNSHCTDADSDLSTIFEFTTDGCCDAPAGLAISMIGESNATANWNAVLAAQSYEIRIREVGTSDWTNSSSTTTTFAFTGLEGCTDYEVQIQTICANEQTDFTSSITFRTFGCGACTDLTYCTPPELNAGEEWIESVELLSLNNNSGSDNGFGDFTGGIAIDLERGDTYSITVTPGFAGQEYEEGFRVWIDLNQDGDFEESDEMVFESANTTTAVTGDITIPNSAVLGLTRMRVAMYYNTLPEACTAPPQGFGEIEDYCVNLVQGMAAPCLIPSNLDTVSVTTTEVQLQWDEVTGAVSYLLRYKAAAVTNWTELSVTTNTHTLSGLETCQDYEVQVKTVCADDQSDYTDQISFKMDCLTATQDLSGDLMDLRLYPNPFTDDLKISFRTANDGMITIDLLNRLGQVVQSEIRMGGRSEIFFTGKDLSAGLYFVRFRNEEGQQYLEKVVKVAR